MLSTILIILIFISYLIGNFSGAIFISKVYKKPDIRGLGSKNPGTTNMSRVFGVKLGIYTFIIDFIKSLLVVLITIGVFSYLEAVDEFVSIAALLSGLFVILGHNYPVFNKFKGGKGFASAIGVFIVINPNFTLTLLLFIILLLVIVDKMSVVALTFFSLEFIYFIFLFKDFQWIEIFLVGCYWALGVIAHYENVINLIKGKERNLGIRKKICKFKEKS